MKKFNLLLAVLFILTSSCHRSQFSTTSRHYKDGRVRYVNNYHVERNRTPKVKNDKNRLSEELFRTTTITESERNSARSLPGTEISKMGSAPVSRNADLLASVSEEPFISKALATSFIFNKEPKLKGKSTLKGKKEPIGPDTLKNEKAKNLSGEQLSGKNATIRLKNGESMTVKIVNQTKDTLVYQLISEKDITRFLPMTQVHSFYEDTRKTEPVGIAALVLSLLGLVPLFGIPFAVLGVILGGKSLRKIRSNPDRFKGNGLARAGMTIGIIGLIISIVFLIISMATAIHSCQHIQIHI